MKTLLRQNLFWKIQNAYLQESVNLTKADGALQGNRDHGKFENKLRLHFQTILFLQCILIPDSSFMNAERKFPIIMMIIARRIGKTDMER